MFMNREGPTKSSIVFWNMGVDQFRLLINMNLTLSFGHGICIIYTYLYDYRI
jgi:hypothetical protein